MSKAVLVMEMPDSCRECKMFVQSMFYYCAAKDYETEDKWIDECEWLRHNYAAKRPDWCPLEPLSYEQLNDVEEVWEETVFDDDGCPIDCPCKKDYPDCYCQPFT